MDRFDPNNDEFSDQLGRQLIAKQFKQSHSLQATRAAPPPPSILNTHDNSRGATNTLEDNRRLPQAQSYRLPQWAEGSENDYSGSIPQAGLDIPWQEAATLDDARQGPAIVDGTGSFAQKLHTWFPRLLSALLASLLVACIAFVLAPRHASNGSQSLQISPSVVWDHALNNISAITTTSADVVHQDNIQLLKNAMSLLVGIPPQASSAIADLSNVLLLEVQKVARVDGACPGDTRLLQFFSKTYSKVSTVCRDLENATSYLNEAHNRITIAQDTKAKELDEAYKDEKSLRRFTLSSSKTPQASVLYRMQHDHLVLFSGYAQAAATSVSLELNKWSHLENKFEAWSMELAPWQEDSTCLVGFPVAFPDALASAISVMTGI